MRKYKWLDDRTTERKQRVTSYLRLLTRGDKKREKLNIAQRRTHDKLIQTLKAILRADQSNRRDLGGKAFCLNDVCLQQSNRQLLEQK